MSGLGVPSDIVEADMWFRVAAALGDTTAEYQRQNVERRMTVEQMAEAGKRARDRIEWSYATHDEELEGFCSLNDWHN